MRRRRFLPLAAASLGGCTGLVFQPMRSLVRHPSDLGLAYRDVDFAAADGTRLHGWFLPAAGEARGTVVVLHGNAENISTHIGSVLWLPGQGINVFMPDYRGYGLSQGRPSLAGVHTDVAAALDLVPGLEGVDRTRVAVLGQSLGGAIVIDVLAGRADRSSFRLLAVEGAPASLRRVAREKLASLWLTWPFQVPLSWTIDDDYRPIDRIAAIAPLPLVVMADAADQVVPVGNSLDLFAAAGEPKELWTLDGARHVQGFASAAVRRRFVERLATAGLA